ncbi:MAG: zinc ABC transporter substrate-binding protein, partial [Chloroflexi bacterium]|nr:zinc ABC transporter substrate-binding protein [Chloroflexota bacterium]
MPIGIACATDSGAAPTVSLTATDVGLRVVTPVSPITSLAENIGGTRIALQGIIPEGTNSHTFEPVPSVAIRRRAASLLPLSLRVTANSDSERCNGTISPSRLTKKRCSAKARPVAWPKTTTA